jgi:hypothetical protein
MLDLDHPQSEHIFTASRLEDAVLARAKTMTLSPSSRRLELLAECEQLLADLHILNQKHFGASDFIATTIDDLRRRLREVAELRDGHITADRAIGEGDCASCGTKLTNFVFMPSLPREIYCSRCLDIIMPALQRLRSFEGFGTDAI